MAGGGGGGGAARGGARAGRVLSVQSHVVRGHCGNKVRRRGLAAALVPAAPAPASPTPAFCPRPKEVPSGRAQELRASLRGAD